MEDIPVTICVIRLSAAKFFLKSMETDCHILFVELEIGKIDIGGEQDPSIWSQVFE